MRRASTAVAVTALVLAACGTGTDDEETTGPPPSPPTASPDPGDDADPDGDADPDDADPDDGADPDVEPDDPDVAPIAGTPTTDVSTEERDGTRLVVTDLRIGAHDGFDRVTFEVEGGEGVPGWRIAYDDDPRSAGSGQEVEIAGDAVLHVSLRNFAYPTDAPAEPRDGPDRLEPSRTAAVVEVLDDVLFEGHHDFWIGVDEQRPYRVALLEDPTRVVIDIETG